MAGPWDQFAESAPQAESGPWSQFAPEPDMKSMKDYMKSNLETAATEKASKAPETTATPKQEPHPAEGILESIEAGWQMSTAGLISRGQLPDKVVPENAPMFARIASQAATLAGDVPAMLAGAVAGSEVPIVGTAAGAFALPAGVRKILMDHYEKGDIHDFGDFWERSSGTLWEMVKQGTVGKLTGAAGVAAKPLGTLAATTAEIATMTMVGRAVEGEVPKLQDFLDAAILVGGLHGTTRIAGKIRSVYSESGVKPTETLRAAVENPTVKQDLLSSNIEVPEALRSEPAPGPNVKGDTSNSSVLLDSAKNEGIRAEKFEPPVVEAEAPVRSEAESKVLEKIVPSAEKKTEYSWDKTYSKAVDDLHPLKVFEQTLAGEKLPTAESPYDLARLTRGSFGKADQFIENSPFNFKTLENTGTKSLKKIVEPFKEDLDGFRAYAVAKHAIETELQGKATGINIDAAREVVKAGKGKYDAATKELAGYNDHLLQYMVDSQIISKDSAASFREAYKSYVPLYRLVEEGSGPTASGRALNVKNPIKGRTGSERPIIDPIESIIKNTYAFVTLAERNRVLTKMADLAEKNPGSGLMEKVPTKMKAIEVSEPEIAKFFNEHGIDASPEAMTIFRPSGGQLAKDEIAVFREGKREIYKVNPQVAEAIGNLDRESVGLVTQILAKPASWLRAGATLAPDFMARNAIRDQISAFTFSKNGYLPVVDMISGLGSIFKKDEHYQNWLKGGGGNSAMVAIDRNYIEHNIFELSKKTGLMDSVQNVVKNPLEIFRVISEVIENSTRVGEFKKATGGSSDAAAIHSAALDSREVTLDFSRVGGHSQVRAMNMITAFWNAHVQGIDRSVRAYNENKVGFLTKTAAAITVPSVLLWAANHKDPRWEEIPRWQKDLFWIVMTKDHVYRIPKPGELGIIFGSMPERVLEHFFTENPKAFKDLGSTFADALMPAVVPTALAPPIEHWANKSTFTGRSIVPSSAEGLLPELRYTEYTSETAKQLGKLVAAVPGMKTNSFASPAVIENYIRAWSGNMGGYAVGLADQALLKSGIVPDPIKPLSTLADMPVIKAFVIRDPSAGSQSIQDFYDRVTGNEMIQKSVKHLTKTGDYKGAMDLAEGNLDSMVRLDGIKQSLTTQNQAIQKISQNPNMTPVEKRQLIDGIYYQMAESAKMGNRLMDAIEKAPKR